MTPPRLPRLPALAVYQGDAAVVAFRALACEVPLAELYENVDLLDSVEGSGS